jgi:hypothetical protein
MTRPLVVAALAVAFGVVGYVTGQQWERVALGVAVGLTLAVMFAIRDPVDWMFPPGDGQEVESTT